MNDEAANVPIASPPPPARLPPLRIHHILAAIAVTASILAVVQAAHRNHVFEFSQFIESTEGSSYVILCSLALTATGFGIYWRRIGFAYFTQPGQWLLIQQAIAGSVFVLAAILGLLRLYRGWDEFGDWLGLLALYCLAAILGVLIVSVWAAIRISDSAWWRLFFVGEIAMVVIPFLAIFISVIPEDVLEANLSTALLTIMVLAIVGDSRARRLRHWTHWLGTTSLVFVLIVTIAEWWLVWLNSLLDIVPLVETKA